MTLAETVGVIGAVSTLLTLSAILLHKTFAVHRDSLIHLQKMRNLELFVDRWRSDVHSSTRVTPGENLQLTIAENIEVIYSVNNHSIVRTRRQNGESIGHDQWQLPSQVKLQWEVDERGSVPLLIGNFEFVGEQTFEPISLVSRIGVEGRQ